MRYIFYIVFSALLIVITPLLVWFGIWLENQPKSALSGMGPPGLRIIFYSRQP